MESADLIEQVKTLFEGISDRMEVPEIQANRIDVYIRPEDLLTAVRALKKNDWGYLITISAYDTVDDAGVPQIGMLYHFAEENVICSIRLFLPYDQRVIQSICPIIPSATIYERECMELFGIDIQNTADRSKLLLPDDWPDGVYPMLKSFTGLQENKPEEKAV